MKEASRRNVMHISVIMRTNPSVIIDKCNNSSVKLRPKICLVSPLLNWGNICSNSNLPLKHAFDLCKKDFRTNDI